MKKKSEYLSSIQRLSIISDALLNNSAIDCKEYDYNCQTLIALVYNFVVLSEKQTRFVNISGTGRLCVTKFRICIVMLQINLN